MQIEKFKLRDNSLVCVEVFQLLHGFARAQDRVALVVLLRAAEWCVLFMFYSQHPIHKVYCALCALIFRIMNNNQAVITQSHVLIFYLNFQIILCMEMGNG
jgi:hypothetical protein